MNWKILLILALVMTACAPKPRTMDIQTPRGTFHEFDGNVRVNTLDSYKGCIERTAGDYIYCDNMFSSIGGAFAPAGAFGGRGINQYVSPAGEYAQVRAGSLPPSAEPVTSSPQKPKEVVVSNDDKVNKIGKALLATMDDVENHEARIQELEAAQGVNGK